MSENTSHLPMLHWSVMPLHYRALQLLFWTLPLGNGNCLGYRKPNQPYQWLTYKQVSVVHRGWHNLGCCFVALKQRETFLQVLDRAEYLGSGLLQKGCTPSSDQFIGIFAQNRPEVSDKFNVITQNILTSWGEEGLFNLLFKVFEAT